MGKKYRHCSMRFLSSMFAFAVFVLAGCKKDFQQQQLFPKSTPSAFTGQSGTYVPNELIVKFEKGTSAESINKGLLKIGGTVTEKIITKAMEQFGDKEGIQLIHTKLQVPDALALLKTEAGIQYAEPNFIYHHDAVSNDPYYTNGSLWGMYGPSTSPANQYGSQAGAAWAADKTGSNSVFVGVIDEGAMFAHEDLSVNFWTNPFDGLDGVDNDHNGYIDDIHGWDFDGNNNSTFDGTGDDHGTHVSGTIGARGGNGKGVAGVNWFVTIISAKFLGNNGGTTANAIKAVDYITDLKTRHGLNLPATNNSWGGGGFSQGLQDAINRANSANILFIAAAGNDASNTDVNTSYPAGYTSANIISVAAITSAGGLASFSNYGANSVDIGAPGSGIYSTIPLIAKGKNKTPSSGYSSYSGTSMATPHVTGTAALYASVYPGATASQIKNAILSTAVPTASLAGKCTTGGRLNVNACLNATPQ